VYVSRKKIFTNEETTAIIILSKETVNKSPNGFFLSVTVSCKFPNNKNINYLFLAYDRKRSICMKVVFWNGISMSEGLTDYVAAIGAILSLEYNCEVILGSNYVSNHMLQDCFFYKKREEDIAHAPYCFIQDSIEYYRVLWSMKGSRKSNILEIPMEGVTIVFPPDVAEKKLFYYNVPETTYALADVAGENITTLQGAVEESDLFVVFLPQNEFKIQKFFRRFSSIIPHAIFVIEEQQRSNRLFYRKIVAEFGIKNKNIVSIPKSRRHKEACEEGNLEVFLKENFDTNMTKYDFISGVRNLARHIYSYCS